MNLGYIARLLAGFSLFFTLSLLVPLAVSLIGEQEGPAPTAFIAAIVSGLALGAGLWIAGRRRTGDFYRKEGLAVVGLAWVVAGILGAIPFYWGDTIPSFVDAFFETVSGLTTTGATVLGTANVDIESLPTSMLLWRSMLQWMGGIGIVLVFIVLLPFVGVTGSRLLSSEQVGVSDQAVRPRMGEQARRLFVLYVVLTALAALAFWAAGLPAFDAFCHSLTTLATGGFSNNNVSIGGYRNLQVELVAITFMFIAGCNFLFILRVLSRGNRTSRSSVFHDTEFKVYLGLTVIATLGITASLWFWGERMPDESLGTVHDYSSLGRCLRDGAFQTVSILTSTGYANANFEGWPKPALYLLFICMVVGGCTGSTAGGFKVLRLVICGKLAGYTLRQFIQPRAVEKLKVGPEVISDRVVSAVVGLLILWIATVAVGTLILGLDPRLDLMSALTASVSMMGCIGPAFGEVVPAAEGSFELVGNIDLGPYSGYGELHPATKIFMAMQMVLGRLEILAPLALLTPRFWKR